jgi:hypothetical protein
VVRFAGLAPYVAVVKTALNMTDAELAMIGTDRVEADPLADLSDKEIAALAAAVAELERMKRASKGE